MRLVRFRRICAARKSSRLHGSSIRAYSTPALPTPSSSAASARNIATSTKFVPSPMPAWSGCRGRRKNPSALMPLHNSRHPSPPPTDNHYDYLYLRNDSAKRRRGREILRDQTEHGRSRAHAASGNRRSDPPRNPRWLRRFEIRRRNGRALIVVRLRPGRLLRINLEEL